MTRVPRYPQQTFSSSVQLKNENYFFKSMELDGWLSSKLKKTAKIFVLVYI